jgi:hypothetical protein
VVSSLEFIFSGNGDGRVEEDLALHGVPSHGVACYGLLVAWGSFLGG